MSTSAEKTVVCPSCKGPSLYAPANRYRPFCSERCKNLDLGAWASERFTLPEQGSNHDPRLEQA